VVVRSLTESRGSRISRSPRWFLRPCHSPHGGGRGLHPPRTRGLSPPCRP
jgi:hypothetical protein